VGTNDHTPNKSQRSRYKGRQAVREVLYWNLAAVTEMLPFIIRVSESGGYVGLGRNSTGDCLLIYVKLDDWNERIPVESYDELAATVAALCEEL